MTRETSTCKNCGGNVSRPEGQTRWSHAGEMWNCKGAEGGRVTGYSIPMRRIREAAIKNTTDSFALSQDWDGKIDFASKVNAILADVGRLLISKNEAYGDSALNPTRIFSKADSVEQLKVRIDDKLSRVQRGNDYGEDTVTDLIGYLTLLKIAEGEAPSPR